MNSEGTNRLARHVEGFRGAVCTGIDFGALSYETNYPGDTEGAWRPMPWGLELIFPSGSLLVGAMQHGHFMDDILCADEIVVVHDPALIEKLKASRSGQRGEWTTWANPGV